MNDLPPLVAQRRGAPAKQFGLVFLIALVWMLATAAHAAPQPVLVSHDADFQIALAGRAVVFLDQDDELSLDKLIAKPSLFRSVGKQFIDFGLTDARIWVKATLTNPSEKDGVWRLDLRRQFVSSMNVYFVRNGAPPSQVLAHTDRDPFTARPILNRYLAVDVPIAGGETTDVYISYRSEAATWLPLTVTSREAYAASHAREDSLNWLINGALLSVLLIAILLTPVVNWQVSTAFCAYISSGALFVFNSEGYAFQYLWPNAPQLNDPLNLVFILLMSTSGPAFGRVFFDVQRHSRTLDRILLLTMLIAAVLALLTIPLFRFDNFKITAYPFVVVASCLHAVTGVFAFRRGLLGATPFLVGSFFVLASLLFALLAHLNPGRISLERTLDVGHLTLLIDAVAFAMAIAIRLVGMRRERDAAMQADLHSAREQLRLAEALQRSQAQYGAARELAARRQEELSSVAHDIAQPLASLRAAMTVMEGVDDATTRQMHAAFDYLEILARRNSVSDIAAEAAGVALEVFPVSAVLDNVFQMFGGEARAKSLHLRYRSCDARVRGDPIALMRMVGNLVANAVKHTQSGAVLLGCRRRKGCVLIEVWDTGPGMDENQLQGALERYAKGAHSAGQGLGLPLVKEMAEKHGVRFFLQSRPGKGTRAVLELSEQCAG